MPPGQESLLGGVGGALLGGLGGFFAARERRKALDRFRRRQQQGINRARSTTEERVTALTDNPLLKAANEFLLGSFTGDETDPLTSQFSKRLQVAQESRGLRRSTAAAVAEASSLAAFRAQFLAGLLPQAERFGTLEERFRSNILQQELPIGIAFETGAPIPGVSQLTQDVGGGFSPLAGAFQGAVSGGLGGFQIGSSFGQQSAIQDALNRGAGGGFGGAGQVGVDTSLGALLGGGSFNNFQSFFDFLNKR